MSRIILASASPRRRELLAQIGLEFEVRVSDVEEKITSEEPGTIVEELARQKAEAVLVSMQEKAVEGIAPEETDVNELLVIGADTVVAYGEIILGKPKDEQEARNMLTMISGHTHKVYTGVCLLHRTKKGVERKCFHEETKVSLWDMTPEEIAFYISTGEPMDKAGAYGIQGIFARYVKEIAGDYNNIVGLPVGRLYQEIRKMCWNSID